MGGVILTLFVTTVLLSGLPLLNNQQKWIFNWHGYAWYCQLSSPKKVSFNWLRLIMVIMNVAQQINQNGLLNQCSRNKLSSRAIIRTRSNKQDVKFIINSWLKQRNNWDKKRSDQTSARCSSDCYNSQIDGQYWYQTVYKMAPSDLSVERTRLKGG